MADDKSKPAIPAWQRAQQPQQDGKQEVVKGEAASAPSKTEVETPAGPEETSSVESSLPEESAAAQLDNMKGDFESFRQQQAKPTPPTQQKPAGPPIITYPEFLVEAHKPPPLITLGRIWNTAQIASGVAAVIYGASKYLVAPMTASLNESRHDFALHSLSKLDELNERLSKLVSKPPEYKKELGTESELDEAASETSDPTELYHRDIGTQTSPLPSRSPSTFGLGAGAEKKKDPTEYQVTGLNIIKSHLDEMLERSEKLDVPIKERQDKLSSLRHYLDTLMYASPGISVWSTGDEFAKVQDADGKCCRLGVSQLDNLEWCTFIV